MEESQLGSRECQVERSSVRRGGGTHQEGRQTPHGGLHQGGQALGSRVRRSVGCR